MTKLTAILLFLLGIISLDNKAQQPTASEKYGKTLSLGLGIGGYSGFYRYANHPITVLHLNYNLDVVQNFTAGVFANFSTYTKTYYWGDQNNSFQYYHYRETIIPLGIKAVYYFDQILRANPKWDFYLGGSCGYVLSNSNWDNGYAGDKNHFHSAAPIFLAFDIGSVYHINEELGIFLNVSNTVSTLGITIH